MQMPRSRRRLAPEGIPPVLWVLPFRLGIGFFAVPRDALLEVLDWASSDFSALIHPDAPCPLVDLRFLTGRPGVPPEKDFRLLVLESAGHRAAILADQVDEVALTLPPLPMGEAPPPGGRILGVVEHRGLPFLLLNPEALVLPKRPVQELVTHLLA